MTEVLDVVAVTPPGSDVTVYSVIGQPPSEAGAVHETTARTSCGVADTPLGAPGTRARVTEFDASEDRLVPLEFVAVTVKVYAVPLVRPVTVSEVAVVVAVIPPRSVSAVHYRGRSDPRRARPGRCSGAGLSAGQHWQVRQDGGRLPVRCGQVHRGPPTPPGTLSAPKR